MNTRYFIGFTLPQPIDTAIRNWYKTTFDHNLPLSLLHLTILPPFFADQASLHPLSVIVKQRHHPFPNQSFKTKPLKTFVHTHKAQLFLPITPKSPLTHLHQHLLQVTNPLVTFDLTPYHSNQLPPFEPHITLNYQYADAHIPANPPLPPFNLDALHLFQELKPGLWQPVAQNAI